LKLGNRNWKIVFAITLLASTVFAFEATLSVNPPIISLGEAAQIQIEVRNAKRPGPPEFPSVEGLTFSGTGKSSQMNIINGRVNKSVAYSTTVYPQKTGEFIIGPFDYTTDGKTKTLQGRLKVVATAGDAAQPQSWSDLVFAKLKSSQNRVYVQEPFELTLSIHSRQGVQTAQNIGLQNMPETGLSEPAWAEQQRTRESIDGTLYDVRRYTTTVRAMGAGNFEFEPVVTVPVVMPNQRRSFFGQYQTRPVEIQLDQTTIEVRPLPTPGKPNGFSGAVGRFNFKVSAQPLDVHPGDPVTLTMRITGSGNFDRILPPALPENDSFRLFGDAVRQQGNNGVRFEQVISPRHAETTEIPSIPFSFFDTETEKYITVASRAIPITVTASSNDTAQLFATPDSVLPPVEPHRPLIAESELQLLTRRADALWKSIKSWLPIVPPVAAVILLSALLIHWLRRRHGDPARRRHRHAPHTARRALRKASTALRHNDAPAFYESVWQALSAYFSGRLNLASGEVSAGEVLPRLTSAGLENKYCDELRLIFEKVDEQRYGTSSAENNLSREMKSILANLQLLLERCNKLPL